MKKLFYLLCILLTGLIVIACDNGTTPTQPPITENPPTIEQTKVIATLNGTVVTITPASNGHTLKSALHALVTDDNRETITKIIITSPDGKKIIPENDLSSLFSDPTGDIFDWNHYVNLTTIEGLENIDTSNVTSMFAMFYGCSKLSNIDLSSFDTFNVTNMRSMFSGCRSITSLNLTSFNTANVTTMRSMFLDCRTLETLNLTSFNTAKVTDMDSMFNDCSSITDITFANSFNTSKVNSMQYMFSDCSSIESLDLSNFDTTNVTDMTMLFYNCSALENLNLSNWNTHNVTETSSEDGSDGSSFMFHGCDNLKKGGVIIEGATLSSPSNVQDKISALPEESVPTNPLPTDEADFIVSEDGATVTKYIGTGSNVIIPSTINGINITEIGTQAFVGIDGNPNTLLNTVVIPDSVTRIGGAAFRNCSGLTEITMGDKVKVIDSSAFWGCSNLESVSIPNSVTHIGSNAFRECNKLKKITIPNGVTNIGGGALYNCRTLETITIPSSVTSIGSEAFYFCNSLDSITVEATNPPSLATSMLGEDAFTKAPLNMIIYVPAERVNIYKAASRWSLYKSRIQAIQ